MPLRTPLLAAAAVALAGVPAARADTTTVLEPPAKSPVTIPGSSVQAGDALTDGQLLLRRTVAVRAGRTRRVTLRCPDASRHAGLGVFDDARVGFAVVGGGSYVGHRVVRLRAFAAPKPRRGMLLRASVFALCESPSP